MKSRKLRGHRKAAKGCALLPQVQHDDIAASKSEPEAAALHQVQLPPRPRRAALPCGGRVERA